MKYNNAYKILIFFIGLLSCSMHAQQFDTIQEIASFMEMMPELPQLENNNVLKPDYSKHYKKAVPGGFRFFVSKIFESLGFKKKLPWTPSGFKELLEEVVALRTKTLMHGDFVQRLTLPSDAKVIVWGDVQGAFHSLSRSLLYLHKKNIIDDSLVITANDHYFVFNGDLIDRSAYNLETLTVVLQLLKKNQDKVFYIRGNHEERERWMDFDLRRQLEVQAKKVSDERPPLATQINALFSTLPLALYLTDHSNGKTSAIRISHYGKDEKRLNEEKFDSFLMQPGGKAPDLYDLSQKKGSRRKDGATVAYPFIVRGISRSTIYQPTDGLTLMAPDQGSTAWTLLSAPTLTYQKLYEFYNDAFCIISPASKISDWAITLYKQDSRKKDGFVTKRYNMLLGQQEHDVLSSSHGQSKKKIVVASTLDQTKSSKILGKRLKDGLTMAVNQINKKGSIKNTRLQLVVYDDYYTASRTKKLIEQFKKNHEGSILLTPLGTPTTKSLLAQVKRKELMVLFPYSGAGVLRDRSIQNIIHYRTSYDNEARALIRHALDSMKKNRFAFFFQDDSYGRAPLKASQDMLTEAGITEWCEAPYMANTTEVENAAKIIREFSPDIIVFFSTLPPSAELIRKLGAEYLATKHLMGISFLTDQFRDFLDEKGIDFIISRVVPNPFTSELEIAQEYRAAASEEQQALSADAFEAYINAALFKQALQNTTPPFTHRKIMQQLESMKTLMFKGLLLDFDPQARELSKNIWIDTGEDTWIFYDARDLLAKTARSKESKSYTDSTTTITPEKDDKIVLGSTLWLSERGGLSPSIRRGMELRVREANRDGGIRGKRIEMIFLDDNYEPDKARKNAQELLRRYQTNVMVGPNGSATLQGYVDMVKDGKILVMFPITGAHPFRNKELKNMVHIRASYPDEAKALTNYAINTLESRRLAIFYQQDLFGETGLEYTRKALEGRDDIKTLEVSYQRRTAAMKDQAQMIRDYSPDAIIFYGTDKAGAALIRDLGVDYLGSKNLMGYSDFSITWFQEFIEDRGLAFAVAQILPNWQEAQEEIVGQFRQALSVMQDHQVGAANQFVLEGYLAVDLALSILDSVQGELTHENIVDAFESLENYDYKGLQLNFNPLTRELSRTIWIDPGNGKPWIKQSNGDH